MDGGIGDVLALPDCAPNLSEVFTGLDGFDLRQDLLAKDLKGRFPYVEVSHGIV